MWVGIRGYRALAAVGAAYALMSFLTHSSGAVHGKRAVFSPRYGEKNERTFKSSMFVSFVLVAAVALVLNTAVFPCLLTHYVPVVCAPWKSMVLCVRISVVIFL